MKIMQNSQSDQQQWNFARVLPLVDSPPSVNRIFFSLTHYSLSDLDEYKRNICLFSCKHGGIILREKMKEAKMQLSITVKCCHDFRRTSKMKTSSQRIPYILRHDSMRRKQNDRIPNSLIGNSVN